MQTSLASMVKRPAKKKVSVWLHPSLEGWLRHQAAVKGLSMAAVLESLLWKELDRQ